MSEQIFKVGDRVRSGTSNALDVQFRNVTGTVVRSSANTNSLVYVEVDGIPAHAPGGWSFNPDHLTLDAPTEAEVEAALASIRKARR